MKQAIEEIKQAVMDLFVNPQQNHIKIVSVEQSKNHKDIYNIDLKSIEGYAIKTLSMSKVSSIHQIGNSAYITIYHKDLILLLYITCVIKTQEE